MGGGDLNMKKSWHPALLVNQEKVWKAEKASIEEKKALQQLRKEREEERQLAELQRMQEASTGKKRVEKLDWMYAAPGGEGGMGRFSERELEDYLLGKKRVDEMLRAGDQDVGNSHKDFIAVQNANSARDTAAKIREDPMLAMKKAEQAALQALMNRPDVRRQLREKKEREGERESGKEERRRKREERRAERSDRRERRERGERDRHHRRRSRSRSSSPRRRDSPPDERRYSPRRGESPKRENGYDDRDRGRNGHNGHSNGNGHGHSNGRVNGYGGERGERSDRSNGHDRYGDDRRDHRDHQDHRDHRVPPPRRPEADRKPYPPSKPPPANNLDDMRAARLAAMTQSADQMYADRAKKVASRDEEDRKVFEKEQAARARYHKDEAAGMFMKQQEQLAGGVSMAESLQRRGGRGLLKDI